MVTFDNRIKDSRYFAEYADEHGISQTELYHAIAEGFRCGKLSIVGGEIFGTEITYLSKDGERLCGNPRKRAIRDADEDDRMVMSFIDKRFYGNLTNLYSAIRFALEKGRIRMIKGAMVPTRVVYETENGRTVR